MPYFQCYVLFINNTRSCRIFWKHVYFVHVMDWNSYKCVTIWQLAVVIVWACWSFPCTVSSEFTSIEAKIQNHTWILKTCFIISLYKTCFIISLNKTCLLQLLNKKIWIYKKKRRQMLRMKSRLIVLHLTSEKDIRMDEKKASAFSFSINTYATGNSLLCDC